MDWITRTISFRRRTAPCRTLPALVVAAVLGGMTFTACASSSPLTASERRENVKTCASLGTTGSVTVTCSQLLPRALEERAKNGYTNQGGASRQDNVKTCASLGITGAGTVTCMQLLPRVLEEREKNGY